MKNFICTASVVLFLIHSLSAHPTQAATINVPADHASIQGGIDAAVDGDLVLVAPGIYFENINFLGKAITLQGAMGADETVIDGDQLRSVVVFDNDETEESVLDGFTLRNGHTTGMGGGICCHGSSPTIMNCTIVANSSAYKGGGISSYFAGPTIRDCKIMGNSAVDSGGGMYVEWGSGPITGCLFRDNYAGVSGGGLHNTNGAITISNSTFEENVSGSDGGGISGKSETIENCIIKGNSAVEGGGIHSDGGAAAGATIKNCTISMNRASVGGGIYVHNYSSVEITNCTISDNSASNKGGGLLCQYKTGTRVLSSILWGNSAPIGPEACLERSSSGTGEITLKIGYSDILGGETEVAFDPDCAEPDCTLVWLEGNIDSDPLFLGGGDYRLSAGSPCIDAGDPDPSYNDSCFPPSLGSALTDMGAFGGPGACGWCGDHDGDGHESVACGGDDCDDTRPEAYAGAVELCDGRDTDCDGIILADELEDADEDGWILCADCDDADPAINPGGVEICDDIDWDCSGDPHDRDFDHDGFFDADPGCMGDDCDDSDPETYPGVLEICDGKDNDCDGILPADEADGDGDGWMACEGDCDDTTQALHPGLIEGSAFGNCDDGMDNDCDGMVDTDPACGIVINIPGDYPTIQQGIQNAIDGVLVTVESGTYLENIVIDKVIALQSISGPDATVLDGSMDDWNGSVVTFETSGPSEAILDGFTITNGSGNCDYCYVPGHLKCCSGGGIYISGTSSPTIRSCTISGNGAAFGGGIYSEGPSPTITDCTISDNSAALTIIGGKGGGIHCSGSPTISNCIIAGNQAWADGPGYSGGGGIYCGDYPVITHCTIWGNTAVSEYSHFLGGGLYEWAGDATITNCIFWENSAAFSGSQIVGSPVVTYSDVQGGWSGEGNIDADPLLLGGGDFHLNPGSPCIDTGTDAGGYADMDGDVRPFGAGFDMGADEYTGEYWAFVLDASYGEGTLSLQFTLGLLEPATWANYLILIAPSVQVIPLWTVPLPAVLPPMEVPISFPLPSLGWVGIYSGLFTTEGSLAYKLEWVDTGS